MKQRNLYILIPNTELNKRYCSIYKSTFPNVGNNCVCIHPTAYTKSWYGDYLQIELSESCYLQRANIFTKMKAIITESAEAFLKKFPHPKTEDDGDFYI